MTRPTSASIVLAFLLVSGMANAQTPAASRGAAAPSDSKAAGEWKLTTTAYGNELHQRMSFQIDKGKVSGWIFEGGKRAPISGTSDASGVRFENLLWTNVQASRRLRSFRGTRKPKPGGRVAVSCFR